MNVRINQLVKSLLQKDSIEQCSIDELQQYAERHPYFGAAQLLFAKKLKVENDAAFNQQLQKTYLFFHNPLWVEALLNENGQATVSESKTNLEITAVPENKEEVKKIFDKIDDDGENENNTSTIEVNEDSILEEAITRDSTVSITSNNEILPLEETVKPIDKDFLIKIITQWITTN